MIEKARKKAPPVNLGNKGNKNCPFGEIGEVRQRGSLINRAIALISLISPIALICYFPREYPLLSFSSYFPFLGNLLPACFCQLKE
jgi:hypothetical protein